MHRLLYIKKHSLILDNRAYRCACEGILDNLTQYFNLYLGAKMLNVIEHLFTDKNYYFNSEDQCLSASRQMGIIFCV